MIYEEVRGGCCWDVSTGCYLPVNISKPSFFSKKTDVQAYVKDWFPYHFDKETDEEIIQVVLKNFYREIHRKAMVKDGILDENGNVNFPKKALIWFQEHAIEQLEPDEDDALLYIYNHDTCEFIYRHPYLSTDWNWDMPYYDDQDLRNMETTGNYDTYHFRIDNDNQTAWHVLEKKVSKE